MYETPFMPLINWIISFMVAVSPINEQIENSKAYETPQVRAERYTAIAYNLVEVIFDPHRKPLFKDPNSGRSHTLAIILSIMAHESKFYRHIDYGMSRGDNGKSWCMMQVMAGRYPNRTPTWNIIEDRQPFWGDDPNHLHKGFTGRDLIRDRRLCIQEGLKIARLSFSRCGTSLWKKLRVYASGSCRKGIRESMDMISVAEYFWGKTKHVRTWNDANMVRKVGIMKEKSNVITLFLSPSRNLLDNFPKLSKDFIPVLFSLVNSTTSNIENGFPLLQEWEVKTLEWERNEPGKFIGLAYL
jgi:hypothetical protein